MNNKVKVSHKLPRKLNYWLSFLGLWSVLSFLRVAQANPVESEITAPNSSAACSDRWSLNKEEEPQNKLVFGDKGSKRWYIQGAGATTVDDAAIRSFILGGAGISQFFVNGHSINLELNKMSFFQTGDDAVGLNLALLLQWHFYRAENWSIFIDGGAGILGTTNDVPSSGSSFNFTPQVGGGTTIRLADDKRLILGIRWHHLSNADLYEDNPGRDSVMGYVGLNLPR